MPAGTPATVNALRDLVSGSQCVMFSTTWCPWCTKAQEFIESKNGGRSCRKIDLDKLPPELASSAHVGAVLSALTGQNTVPNVFIARKHIGGYEQVARCEDMCRNGSMAPEHKDVCGFLMPDAQAASA